MSASQSGFMYNLGKAVVFQLFLDEMRVIKEIIIIINSFLNKMRVIKEIIINSKLSVIKLDMHFIILTCYAAVPSPFH